MTLDNKLDNNKRQQHGSALWETTLQNGMRQQHGTSTWNTDKCMAQQHWTTTWIDDIGQHNMRFNFHFYWHLHHL